MTRRRRSFPSILIAPWRLRVLALISCHSPFTTKCQFRFAVSFGNGRTSCKKVWHTENADDRETDRRGKVLLRSARGTVVPRWRVGLVFELTRTWIIGSVIPEAVNN